MDSVYKSHMIQSVTILVIILLHSDKKGGEDTRLAITATGGPRTKLHLRFGKKEDKFCYHYGM